MFNNAKIPEKPLGKPEETIHKITQKREKNSQSNHPLSSNSST